jgi:hypothetical protein
LAGTTLRQSYATQDSAGLYSLAAAPDCTEPYHGEYAKSNLTLYVVALGTKDEQLFRRSQRNEATRLARTGRSANGGRLTLDQVHPSNLCHEVVVGFLGS